MTRITRRSGDPRTEPRLQDNRPERGLAWALILAALFWATVAIIWSNVK